LSCFECRLVRGLFREWGCGQELCMSCV
jgi:hypothetical protein